MYMQCMQKSGRPQPPRLNLSDGHIGGGRKFWDGTGGSNGALDHFNEEKEKAGRGAGLPRVARPVRGQRVCILEGSRLGQTLGFPGSGFLGPRG